MFTTYGGLQPQPDVDKLYIPRKNGGRSLIAIEVWEELAVRCLEVYIHGNEERLGHTATGEKLESLKAASVLKKAKKEKRLPDMEEKTLHG